MEQKDKMYTLWHEGISFWTILVFTTILTAFIQMQQVAGRIWNV